MGGGIKIIIKITNSIKQKEERKVLLKRNYFGLAKQTTKCEFADEQTDYLFLANWNVLNYYLT